MKPYLTRIAHKVTLVAAVLLVTCLFGSPVNAQADFQGKFTLPYEIHWGQAALPAGDYLLTISHDTITSMLVIRDAKSRRTVAFESIFVRQDSNQGHSALLIGTRGKQRVVHSLRLAELGQVFIYDRELASGRSVKEAQQTQAIPVLMAKK